MGIGVAVLGASGFAGGELLRLLAGHSGMKLIAAAASRQIGRKVRDLYPAPALGEDLEFVSVDEALKMDADLVFSSLPFGQSAELFGGKKGTKVVDISGDFRLKDNALYEEWYGQSHPVPEDLARWVYGLTEFHRDEIPSADRVANPGCYPTAALLALVPLMKNGLIESVGIHIDAMSGLSGAGRASAEGFDYSSANENVRPYAIIGHKHIPEIEQELGRAIGSEIKVSFVPHLAPMTRGILATCSGVAGPGVDQAHLLDAYQASYTNEPFVRVLQDDSLPETKRLSGTNFAEVTARLDTRTGRVIAFCGIDNLGKGAAGQALQNANLMCGFQESEGLEAMAVVP